jgi:DNA (cytosine-5)-methyltransferase 1
MRTITGANRGDRALIAPHLIRTAHGDVGPNSRRWGKGEHPLEEPLPTVAASKDFALSAPYLAGVGGAKDSR